MKQGGKSQSQLEAAQSTESFQLGLQWPLEPGM